MDEPKKPRTPNMAQIREAASTKAWDWLKSAQVLFKSKGPSSHQQFLEEVLQGALDGDRVQIAKWAIQEGATNHKTSITPMIRAINHQNDRMLSLLLRSGAPVNGNKGKALTIAAAKNNASTCRILIEAGADIHVNASAALTLAAERDCLQSARVLLEAGANPNAKNHAAFFWAAMKDSPALTRLLLEHGLETDGANVILDNKRTRLRQSRPNISALVEMHEMKRNLDAGDTANSQPSAPKRRRAALKI